MRLFPSVSPPRRTHLALAGGLLFATGCWTVARAADPQPYSVKVTPTGNSSLDAALSGSSSLVSLQKTEAVSPFALAGRARGDYDRLKTALESFGYYDGHVAILIDGHEASDAATVDAIAAIPKGRTAKVVITAHEGPMFHIGHISMDLPPGQSLPATVRHDFDLRSGQDAVASQVLDAQGALLSGLRETGHALADVPEPVAYLKPATHTLDIVFKITPGPRVDIGHIFLDGLGHVHESFIRRRLLIHPGELWQPSRIEAARQDLASLGVFSDVAVKNDPPPGRTLDVDGRMPLLFSMQEAKRHTVSVQAGYSTDLGGSAGVTWTHHNLFGNAERLDLVALGTGLVGTAVNGLGYDIYAKLTKPDFLRRNQNLTIKLEGLKQNLYSYNQTALIAFIGLDRRFSKHWTGAVGLQGEREKIIQEGLTRHYTLVQLPVSANFDNTDLASPLDSPTHGFRVSLTATPTVSLGSGHDVYVPEFDSVAHGGTREFAILQGTATTYFDVSRFGWTKPGHTVIALRGIVGSVQGASTFDLPPDQRLYAGGSATVRGFRYQGIGPVFADGYPVGGVAMDAGSFELRQRVWNKIGMAAFLDAGQVSTSSRPFQGTVRYGAGIGGRYYTSIGPLRVDVAVPLNRPKTGKSDAFELYIGLGEAF